jgi:hypothetical protein
MATTPAGPRKCFVISPIGLEGSEVREHADDVFEFIIQPAMQELGLHAYRSDHNTAAGKITEQMFDSLLKDDLCVAILTFHNPNVFYELAIAQSAARPTVILIEKGTAIPFDLRDIRAIEYDFKPRAMRDRLYVKQLIEHIRSIERNGWRAEVPFGQGLSPLGGNQQSLVIHEDIRGFGGEERWFDVLKESGNTFRAAGIAMPRWTKRRSRSILEHKARCGEEVRILVMHPDHPVLTSMVNETDRTGSVDRVRNAVAEMCRMMEEMARHGSSVQLKLLRHGLLYQQIVITERTVIMRPHLYSHPTPPVLVLERAAPIAQAFESEFEALWQLN